MKPLRLCVVLTHPVQYYAPWFRHIAMSRPDDIDLTVLYATRPLASQQSVGFGGAFAWDVPLLEGYRSVVLRPATADTDVHSDSFWGADAPQVGAAILEARPDAVLVMGWYSSTNLRAIWTALRHGIPLLYHGDTNLMSAPSGWRRPLWAIKTRFLLSRFDAFLSVGRRAGAFLRFLARPTIASLRLRTRSTTISLRRRERGAPRANRSCAGASAFPPIDSSCCLSGSSNRRNGWPIS